MKKIVQIIKQRSLTRKLLISFLAILILPISTLAFIAYQSAVSTLDRQMMGSALDNVQQINDMINTSISQKEDGTAYFSDWLTKDRYKPKNHRKLPINSQST